MKNLSSFDRLLIRIALVAAAARGVVLLDDDVQRLVASFIKVREASARTS